MADLVEPGQETVAAGSGSGTGSGAGSGTGGRGRVQAVVVVPPPVNGMTLVSQHMVQRLATETGPLSGPPPGPVSARPGQVGLRWTLAKHLSFLRSLGGAALRGLFRPVARRPVGYFVPDSGGGLWLNLLEAPLLRWGYREVWLHHHVFSYVSRRDRRVALFLRLLGAKAQHITLGQAMSDGLAARYGVPAARLHPVGNADFVSDVPEAVPARPALRCLGYLGNITRAKGIGLALQTMAAVQARAPEVTCQIAGPIADAALRAEVEAFCAAAPETRRWLGPVGGADKVAFFDAVDVLLFPSQYANEALPVTIYEALAAGAPVLATPRGVIPDQLAGPADPPWLCEETRFVAEATSCLLAWQADKTAFQAASTQARALYDTRRTEDKRALGTVLQRMSGADRPNEFQEITP